MVVACSNKILWPKIFDHFTIEITIENFKWPAMDRLWVYNAEIFFVDSTHLVAPYIQKQRLKAKKVVLRNTLVHMFLNPPGPPYMSKNAKMCYF